MKDTEVAKKMVYFVDRSTIGVSRDSQLRATKILSLVSDAYDDDKGNDTRRWRVDLFGFTQRRMAERCHGVHRHLQPTGGDIRLLHLQQANGGSHPSVRVAALR